MKRPIAPLLVFIGALALPLHALDFDLATFRVEEDGFSREHSYFLSDQNTRIVIDLPKGWTPVGTPASLTLSKPPNSILQLEKSPLSSATPFKEPGLSEYRRRLAATVPEGATNVRIVQEQADPLPLFHWKDYGIVVEYQFYGIAMRRAGLFINLETGEQLVLWTAAERTAFDVAQAAGLGLLQSWSPQPRTEVTGTGIKGN